MKVLHICQRDDPATGGAVRVAVEFVKRLPEYQIDVRCLFLYGSPGYFQSELGDRAHYLNVQNSKDFLKFGGLTKFLNEFQPDVIHHHDGLLWPQLLTFYHPGRIKVAHAHLDGESRTSPLRGNISALLQRKSTDTLVCITEDIRQKQIRKVKYLPERTKVIYNGVDYIQFSLPDRLQRASARKQFGLPDNAFVVGFVGRLDCRMKGTDDILKTLALLPSNYWGLIVGSGRDFNYLQQLATELEISDRVVFTGALSKTLDAYHAMDAFCLASYWEHFGLVVAEAMACQVPVVGFACEGGVKELLTSETGYVLQSRNIEEMSKTILQVSQDSDETKRRKVNANNLLKSNHDWDKNTASLANLYRELINHRLKEYA